MAPLTNVTVFGAGGQLGTPVLRALLAAPEFNVTILAREDTNSTYPPGVRVIRTDFSPESLATALKDQDAVVSTVTHMALDKQKEVIHAAVAAGVRRFLPSEYGGDTSKDQMLQAAPFTRVKRQVTDLLRTLEGQGPSGQFSWSAIVPGPFLEWVFEPDEFGINLNTRTVTLYDGGDVPFPTSKLSTIADCVVGVLRNPDVTANRHVYVRSALLTHAKILSALESITASPWTVKHEKVDEDVRAGGLERIENGDFMGNLDLIRAAILTKGTGFDYEPMNNILGISGDEPIEQLVKEIAGEALTRGG
ncbi:isoflavone reductase [Whalleya microplaca]|nr:isoflavone reductase [Whalleya microplaca]